MHKLRFPALHWAPSRGDSFTGGVNHMCTCSFMLMDTQTCHWRFTLDTLSGKNPLMQFKAQNSSELLNRPRKSNKTAHLLSRCSSCPKTLIIGFLFLHLFIKNNSQQRLSYLSYLGRTICGESSSFQRGENYEIDVFPEQARQVFA